MSSVLFRLIISLDINSSWKRFQIAPNFEVVVVCNKMDHIMCPSLDHPDLSSLDERLFTKNFDAKARLTEISVNDMIGLKNINVSMTTNHRDKKFT